MIVWGEGRRGCVWGEKVAAIFLYNVLSNGKQYVKTRWKTKNLKYKLKQ